MTHTPDELRAIAEAATGDVWSRDGLVINARGRGVLASCPTVQGGGVFECMPNALHIATFDPPTMIAFFDERDALLDRLAALEAERAAGEAREWLPIDDDTPRDGTCIVLNSDSPLWRFPFVGVWRKSADHKSGWWHFAEEDMNHLYSVSELVNQWSPVPALAKQGPGS